MNWFNKNIKCLNSTQLRQFWDTLCETQHILLQHIPKPIFFESDTLFFFFLDFFSGECECTQVGPYRTSAVVCWPLRGGEDLGSCQRRVGHPPLSVPHGHRQHGRVVPSARERGGASSYDGSVSVACVYYSLNQTYMFRSSAQ